MLGGDQGRDLLYGGAGNDVLTGGAGNDTLSGGDGNDALNVDEGNDFVLGNDGDNAVFGGEGNDTLVSGGGVDIMDGGAGSDVFFFPFLVPNNGFDGDERILNFNAFEDFIAFRPGGLENPTFIFDEAFSGKKCEIRFAGGYLEIDTLGDGKADFVIKFQLDAGLISELNFINDFTL